MFEVTGLHLHAHKLNWLASYKQTMQDQRVINMMRVISFDAIRGFGTIFPHQHHEWQLHTLMNLLQLFCYFFCSTSGSNRIEHGRGTNEPDKGWRDHDRN